jgi:hypothetical protein
MASYRSSRGPPSSQRLWRVWYALERLERLSLWPSLIRARDQGILDNPTSRYERFLVWWYWDGVGAWLIGHTERAEQRWLRVRYAGNRRRGRWSDRCATTPHAPGGV